MYYFLFKIDDVAKFFEGIERENALHLEIKFYKTTKKPKDDLKEIKQKILQVKKSMLYSKTVEEKFTDHQFLIERDVRVFQVGKPRKSQKEQGKDQ